MNINLREIRKYINEQDPEPKKVIAVLSDIFPKEKQDKNALSMLVMAGVVEEIRDSKGNLDKHRIQAIRNILVNDYFMQEAKAIEAIREWIDFYNFANFEHTANDKLLLNMRLLGEIVESISNSRINGDKEVINKIRNILENDYFSQVEKTKEAIREWIELYWGNQKKQEPKQKIEPKESTLSWGEMLELLEDYKKKAESNQKVNHKLKLLKVGDKFDFGIYDGQPITWRVLKKDTNSLYVLADKIICHRLFDQLSNNWNKSEIRKWLNNEFYKGAFSEYEKRLICNMNGDNITLLSKKEAESLMSKRGVSRTNWWLRSPTPNYSNIVYYVYPDGSLKYINVN